MCEIKRDGMDDDMFILFQVGLELTIQIKSFLFVQRT